MTEWETVTNEELEEILSTTRRAAPYDEIINKVAELGAPIVLSDKEWSEKQTKSVANTIVQRARKMEKPVIARGAKRAGQPCVVVFCTD